MPPLTPAVVHVLLSLADGERHGYAILKDVEQQTAGRVRLGPGTLYGTLQRLMEAGWVEETGGPPEPVDQRRRYYRLSRAGREALKTEIARLEALVHAARARRVVPRTTKS